MNSKLPKTEIKVGMVILHSHRPLTFVFTAVIEECLPITDRALKFDSCGVSRGFLGRFQISSAGELCRRFPLEKRCFEPKIEAL